MLRGRTGRRRPREPSPLGESEHALPPEELVQRCIERLPGSWEEFLRRYADLIYSTILRTDIGEHDREDAFQSSFLAIHNSMGNLRNRESLVPWIIGISYRQAVQRIRSRMRAREVALPTDSESEILDAADAGDPADPPDETRLILERSQQAREAIGRLPDRCRRLIALLFYEDPPLDYADISLREGIPIGSIGPTRARCIDRLRRIFVEEGWVE